MNQASIRKTRVSFRWTVCVVALAAVGFFAWAYWFNERTRETTDDIISHEYEKIAGPIVAPQNPHFSKGSGYYTRGGLQVDRARDTLRLKNEDSPRLCNETLPEGFSGCVEINGKKLYQGAPGRSDYSFTAVSEEELKQKAYQSLLEEYPRPESSQSEESFCAGYNFLESYPADVFPVKPNIDVGEHTYIIIFRDKTTNNVNAFGDYRVAAKVENKEYLRVHQEAFLTACEGFTAASHEVQETVQRGLREYLGISNLSGSYFPIEEEQAREALDQYMKEVGIRSESAYTEWNGYTIIYAYNPVTDEHYPVFEISHEFLINSKHRVWIGVRNGTVVDEPQLEWIAEENVWIARENPPESVILERTYTRTKIYDE